MTDRDPQVAMRYEGLPGLLMLLAVLLTLVLGWGIVRLAPRTPPPVPPEIIARAPVAAPGGIPVRLTAGATTVERTLDRAAFALEGDATLDPRLAPGPFSVTMDVPAPEASAPAPGGAAWVGAIVRDGSVIIRRGNEVLVSDAADATPREAVAAQPVRLGRHERLAVEFRSTGPRPALRMMWRPDGTFAMLPWPVATSSMVVASATRGLVLAQERQCAQCHAVAHDGLRTLLMRHPAPDLSEAGARLRPEWLRLWLRDPSVVRPGTPMPSVGHGDGWAEDTLEDLVHFLAAQGGPFQTDTSAPDDVLRATGLVAYHEVGCFACHGPLESLDALPGGRADSGPTWRRYHELPSQGLKTSVTALTTFLLDPVHVRPSGAMPGMALTRLEAQAIATYLVDRSGAPPERSFELDLRRVRSGRDWFATSGCASCHDLADVPPAVTGPALATLDASQGCLAPQPVSRVPHFDLDVQQRLDLVAFLASVDGWVSPSVPQDELSSEMQRLRCVACHRRRSPAGALGPEPAIERYFVGDEHADLGDEGRLPPDLSDAGARLTTAWMRAVLTGGERARPYLGVRMPEYGAAVEPLPELFVAQDGATEYGDRLAPEFTADSAREGRSIVGADRLNCISCHAIAGRASTGMPGPDLALMPGRLRYASFHRWLSDPALLRPGTRMPSFFVGVDGSAEIGAVWNYLSQGESLPMPEGMEGPGGTELVVGETPIVLRTFMASAGVHAIACGFPEQVHCAFDADRGTITVAWEGQFLSAAGAWANRGGSETNPDGMAWQGPAGPIFALDGAKADIRFGGYALDAAGAPTFTTRLVSDTLVVTVTERPAPVRGERAALQRHLVVDGPAGTTMLLTPGAGVTVAEAVGVESRARGVWAVVLDGAPIEVQMEVTW